MALFEIFGHGMVIGEVAVMHQRHVNGRKRMGAAGMPDAALGGETLMGNPFVGAQLFNFVILYNGFGITDHLEDHDVPAMREHEGPFFTQRRVIFLIEVEAVLVDEFILHLVAVELLQMVLRNEHIEHQRFHADEVTADIRRQHLQTRHGFPVGDLVELRGGRDIKERLDELRLDFRLQLCVDKRHVQQVMAVEHLPADAELFRDEPHRGDAAALAVAAVVHLARRFVNVPARHRLAAAETDHAAAAFLRLLPNGRGTAGVFSQPFS